MGEWDPVGLEPKGGALVPDPAWADAMDANARVARSVGARIAAERAKSVEQGLWNPEAGLPTGKGLGAAVQAYAGGLSDGGVGGMLGAIKAYHGSPHSFERFDLSKVGTGEGAQAYGHGLYFAGNEGVARSYRDSLTQLRRGPEDLTPSGRLAYEAKLADLYQEAAAVHGISARQAKQIDGPNGALAGRALAELPAEHFSPGHMYEVNLDVEPHQLLDWDKPRDQLAPQVQALAQERFPNEWRNAADGSSLYNLIQRGFQSEYPGATKGYSPPAGYNAAALTSQSFRDAGIPGIRYLDQGSRSAGEGTSNYVMFDPDLIKIIRQYAVPGIAGASAAGLDWLPTGYEPAWAPTNTEAKP